MSQGRASLPTKMIVTMRRHGSTASRSLSSRTVTCSMTRSSPLTADRTLPDQRRRRYRLCRQLIWSVCFRIGKAPTRASVAFVGTGTALSSVLQETSASTRQDIEIIRSIASMVSTGENSCSEKNLSGQYLSTKPM